MKAEDRRARRWAKEARQFIEASPYGSATKEQLGKQWNIGRTAVQYRIRQIRLYNQAKGVGWTIAPVTGFGGGLVISVDVPGLQEPQQGMDKTIESYAQIRDVMVQTIPAGAAAYGVYGQLRKEAEAIIKATNLLEQMLPEEQEAFRKVFASIEGAA
jgi:hypothetical protein